MKVNKHTTYELSEAELKQLINDAIQCGLDRGKPHGDQLGSDESVRQSLGSSIESPATGHCTDAFMKYHYMLGGES